MVAERDKYELALYDMVNGKFGKAVRRSYKDYSKDCKGSISVRMSYRAMPLFLVEEKAGDRTTVFVWTEAQIMDLERNTPSGAWPRMLISARHELMANREVAA